MDRCNDKHYYEYFSLAHNSLQKEFSRYDSSNDTIKLYRPIIKYCEDLIYNNYQNDEFMHKIIIKYIYGIYT